MKELEVFRDVGFKGATSNQHRSSQNLGNLPFFIPPDCLLFLHSAEAISLTLTLKLIYESKLVISELDQL